MGFLQNIKLRTKLLTAFLAVTALCAFVGYRGIVTTGHMQDQLGTVYNDRVVPLKQLKVIADMYAVNIVDTSHKTRNGNLSWEQGRKSVDQANQEIAKEWASYISTKLTAEESRLVEELKPLLKAADLSVAKLRDILQKEDKKKLERYTIEELYPVIDPVSEKITSLIDLQLRVAKTEYDAATVTAATERNVAWATILLAMLASLALGFVLDRLITKPLNNAVEMLKDIAQGEGDLTKRLDASGKDEINQLGHWFNQFMDKLHEIISQVKDSADNFTMASGELAAASDNISSGAQEQAASIEETSASLEQLTSTVKQNADNSRQANQLAAGSRDAAESGGTVVSAAIDAMGEINSSSKKIADIITTIDEIAFQTNLLALNAAVEAARAGEQGRGFAVVAAEVRSLAQRSATAAKEIKTLIQDSVRKVDNGTDLVNQSGQTLSEIVASVKRVTDIMSEISAASQEQASGIDQINRAIAQMDQVTQTNASQTEELSSTAQSLSSQSRQLQALVARFRLNDDLRREMQAAARQNASFSGKPSRRPRPKFEPAGRDSEDEQAFNNLVGSMQQHHDTSANSFEEF